MPLIAERPRTWNEVVGQDRQLKFMKALLRSPHLMTRGFIFEGPFAVGKTTCAYLFARALMCLGDDVLGCGKCGSCQIADRDGLDNHPNFREIDGANHSSVEQARILLETLDCQPLTGKRLVVIIDEAHRLSNEAWDVFLKPLERRDTEVMFLFVTSESYHIPGTIASRCAPVRFEKVSTDALIGMMMARADKEGFAYRMDGLQALAKLAQGRPRDAIKTLGLMAAMGTITAETVDETLNFEADSLAERVFELILADKPTEATHVADNLTQRIGPPKAIEAVASFYARDVFGTSSLTPTFAPLKEMNAFFVKWMASLHLSADLIPLFVRELYELRCDQYRTPEVTRQPALPKVPAPAIAAPVPPVDRLVRDPRVFAALMEK